MKPHQYGDETHIHIWMYGLQKPKGYDHFNAINYSFDCNVLDIELGVTSQGNAGSCSEVDSLKKDGSIAMTMTMKTFLLPQSYIVVFQSG